MLFGGMQRVRTCNEERLQTVLLWSVPRHDVLLDATRFDAGSEQASTQCAEPARAEMLRGTIVGEYLASAGTPKSLMQSDRWSRCIHWFERNKTNRTKQVIQAERVFLGMTCNNKKRRILQTTNSVDQSDFQCPHESSNCREVPSVFGK